MATIPAIPLHDITSSRIAALGYDEDTFTLAIRFPPTKSAPLGKVYTYENFSPEQWYDFTSAKSQGVYFGDNILNNPNHPCVCVDDGAGLDGKVIAPQPTPLAIDPVDEIPDDKDAIKALALSTRSDATALTIITPEEYEVATREVLTVRQRRKAAIAKIDAIKTPLRQAWQAAQDLWNEVDGAFAEAESYLDNGILEYRRLERARIAEANAAEQRRIDAERAEALRLQQEEHRRLQAIEDAAAVARAKELAEADAQVAAAQGQPAELVEQIKANPLPVQSRTVAPPPLAYIAPHASIARQEIPKVENLGFKTEWFYTIENEMAIPLSHDFYSLDLKKINGRVQDLKQHANIPGVRVDSREVPIKRTASRK